MPPTAARFAALLPRYDGFLFDAYGVLVDASGPTAGAAPAIAAVRAAGKPLAVVTNDASRLPATAAARFARVGLPIAADEVVSSGQMLAPHVAAAGLAGASTAAVGIMITSLPDVPAPTYTSRPPATKPGSAASISFVMRSAARLRASNTCRSSC